MRALGRSAGVLQPKLLSKDEARRMAVNFAQRANVRLTRAPWKGGAFQWVQIPPGNRSSRKQPEQSWR